MQNTKRLLQSLAGCAALALGLKWLAGRLSHASQVVQDAKPAPRHTSKDGSFKEIDAYIENQIERLKIPGLALAIVEGDTIVHQHGFGQARPGGEVPSPQTPFFIGSLTKSFTALAVMQLVEAGKIELDAPVQRNLSWFCVAPPRGRVASPRDHAVDAQTSTQITVRHLLNQTSGLSVASGWIPLSDLDNRPGASERQARALSTVKLSHPAGTAYEYSNMNYNLLGLIIEAASGESYTAYVENHIFGPLDMRHSYTTRTEAVNNGLAVGHRYWFWFPAPTPAAELPLPQGSMASGQLISTAEDMAHFMIAHLNDGCYAGLQILSSQGTTELHRPAVAAFKMGSQTGQYAMGWFTEISGQTRIVWHSGMVPDFVSYMALLPEQKKGVILLVNADHFMMNPVITEVGAGVVSLLAGRQPAPLKFGFIPWLIRALLLIPLLQIVDVAATLRRVNRWRQDPQTLPSRGSLWGKHILLPLIPNLSLAGLAVYLVANKLFGFMRLFLPDFTWITLICGGFAGIWAFLRTILIFRTRRKPS